MPLRVCGSTVGATMRTVPVHRRRRRPAVTLRRHAGLAAAPGRRAATSARHSRRPWRIRRNSSWPAGSTAPTVALRAEITPSSGASTCVWRSAQLLRLRRAARCASSRACAVRSAVRYWLICWRAERAGGLQLAGALRRWPTPRPASPRPRRRRRAICARSACTVSGAKRRQHLAALDDVADVDPHLGQPQAVGLGADAGLLPGRDVAVGGDAQRQRARCGCVTVTVSAGRGGRRAASVVGGARRRACRVASDGCDEHGERASRASARGRGG